MSTTKMIKRAQKLVVIRNEARSTAAKAQSELNECLQEAVLLAQTVADSMEIYRLSADDKLTKIAWRKAVTLLRTSTKHLWDMALIRGNSHFSHQDAEFRKKEEIILSKINIEWLMSLDKKLPGQYFDMLQRKFGAELRTRFEQEARAATSYEEYRLVSEFYSNLPVDTSGDWGEDGWQPKPTSPQWHAIRHDSNNF